MIHTHNTQGGAHFAFTDRWGGVSAVPYGTLNLGGAVGDDPQHVLRNRELAAQELGLAADGVVWMNQVHGGDVAVVDAPWGDAEPPRVDGLVTARRGLALAVLTADCAPVLLADAQAGVVGAAHAGRPGLVARVVPETVAKMVELGARADRIAVHLGPSVCGLCYEVPARMRDAISAVAPAAYSTTRWGTPAVDIVAGVRAQLAEIGVTRLMDPPACTLESDDHFSYRGEKVTGRLGSYVWLETA